jgi:hypothetical protein
MTGFGLSDRGLIAGWGRIFLHHVQTGSGDPAASYPICTRRSSLDVKRPESEADLLTQSGLIVWKKVSFPLSCLLLHGLTLRASSRGFSTAGELLERVTKPVYLEASLH